jgi:hypothetical protein
VTAFERIVGSSCAVGRAAGQGLPACGASGRLLLRRD